MMSIIKKSRVALIVIGLLYGSATVANAQIKYDSNGAKLKMNVGGSISINKPYIINKGAKLEILLSNN